MITKTPWAALLVKFSDHDAEPYPRQRYEEIFTAAGAGKWNIVDYFRDMSHGKLDLSGSKLFGWFNMDMKRSEYGNREAFINNVRAKAIENGVNLNDFFSVVIITNAPVDMFGSNIGVVCGDDGIPGMGMSSLSAGYLGQEMGHTYGLSHSRQEGFEADYRDPYDIMSAAATFSAPHPLYEEFNRDQRRFQIGPGLNAANMWSQGLLDETRVWKDTGNGRLNATIQLRPLHHRDLPGFLAARFEDYFIEFRMNSGWDIGFRTPVVLVHRYEEGHSYLVFTNESRREFLAGSVLSTPEKLSILGSGISITVNSIDAQNQIATLSFARVPPQLPQTFPKEGPFNTPWIKWSELTQDDALIVIDGNALHIKRSSPFFSILENIVTHKQRGAHLSSRLQSAIRRETLSNIAAISQQELSSLSFLEPTRRLETFLAEMPNQKNIG